MDEVVAPFPVTIPVSGVDHDIQRMVGDLGTGCQGQRTSVQRMKEVALDEKLNTPAPEPEPEAPKEEATEEKKEEEEKPAVEVKDVPTPEEDKKEKDKSQEEKLNEKEQQA